MAEAVTHQIGEVAERVGLSLRTIRYYEEVGLVVPSGRTQGGFRLYTDHDIERLRLIKQMKPLEFSLEDMRSLLTLLDQFAGPDPEQDRDELLDRLLFHVEAVEQRCATLRTQLEIAEGLAASLRATAQQQRRG
jgi:MerR family transcriptional regulator, copper efflux regulator